jgi:hypothetical protein
MTTSPSKQLDCDPTEQQARQDFLDELYVRSGRDRSNHPMHCLYTGLYAEWTQAQQQDA